MQPFIDTSKNTITAKVVNHPSALKPSGVRRAHLSAVSAAQAGKIALPIQDGMRFVRFERLLYARSEGNYCNIHLMGGQKILISKTLKWVQQRLPRQLFLRVHTSYLINMEYIEQLGHTNLRLESGPCIPISRNRRAEVKALLWP